MVPPDQRMVVMLETPVPTVRPKGLPILDSSPGTLATKTAYRIQGIRRGRAEDDYTNVRSRTLIRSLPIRELHSIQQDKYNGSTEDSFK
jgi:hypothetical protein